MTSLVAKMEEMGIQIIEEEEGLRVIGPSELKPIDLKTMPHPGFPTDMQSQMMALLLRANGTKHDSQKLCLKTVLCMLKNSAA